MRHAMIALLLPAALVGCKSPLLGEGGMREPIAAAERTVSQGNDDFSPSNKRIRNAVDRRGTALSGDTEANGITYDGINVEALFDRQKRAFAAGLTMNDNQTPSVTRPQSQPVNTQQNRTRNESAQFSLNDRSETDSVETDQATVAGGDGAPPKFAVAKTRRISSQADESTSSVSEPAKSTAAEEQNAEETRVRSAVENAAVAAEYGAVEDEPVVAKASASVVKTAAKSETQVDDVDNWRTNLNRTITALKADLREGRTSEPNARLNAEATLKILSLIEGDMDAALAPIEGLQPHEQEYMRHQLQAIHDAFDPAGNPVAARRWTLALQSLRKAQAHLAAVSNLEVQNVALCTEVDSFGIVTKFPEYKFQADQKLLLYCELDNFTSEAVKKGFETQLQGNYEILDSNGQRIADQLLPLDVHVCPVQRRDYFIAYLIYTPVDIKPGKYQLRLTMEDLKGRKFGQSTIDFQIVP